MKNIVKRKCISCKELKNREEMFKVTCFENSLVLNPNSKQTGRSAYVCKNEECFKKMIKSKGLKRALKFNNDNIIKEIETKILNDINGLK